MLRHSHPGRKQQPSRVLYQKETVVEEDHLTCEISGEEAIAADMGGFSDVGKTCNHLLFNLHCVAQLTK